VRDVAAEMGTSSGLIHHYFASMDDVLAAAFARVAERRRVAFYPLFLEGVAGDPALNLPDGIHPNAAGVDTMVAKILPSVRRLVAE